METKKAVGQRGSWYVQVDGVKLPCMHKHWLKDREYHDPFDRHIDDANNDRFNELANLTQTLGQIVLSDDKATFDEMGKVVRFERTRYIAVFAVVNVTYSRAEGLRFTVTQRLANLK